MHDYQLCAKVLGNYHTQDRRGRWLCSLWLSSIRVRLAYYHYICMNSHPRFVLLEKPYHSIVHSQESLLVLEFSLVTTTA